MLDYLTIMCCMKRSSTQQRLIERLEEEQAFCFQFSALDTLSYAERITPDLLLIDFQLIEIQDIQPLKSILQHYQQQHNIPSMLVLPELFNQQDFFKLIQLNQLDVSGYLPLEELCLPSFIYRIREVAFQDTSYNREQTQWMQLEHLELWEHLQAFAQIPALKPFLMPILNQEKVDIQAALVQIDQWLQQRRLSSKDVS